MGSSSPLVVDMELPIVESYTYPVGTTPVSEIHSTHGLHGVKRVGIGVDPGRNFGIAIVHPRNLVIMYSGRIEPKGTMVNYAVAAYHMVQQLPLPQQPAVVIEDAAYGGAPGRHVGLAYIRMGFYFGLLRHNIELKSPATMRKAVFGSGKDRAEKQWTNIDKHAADAMNFALYAAGYRLEEA